MDFDDSSFILGKVKRKASFTSYSNFLGTLDHRLGSLEIDGYALARMQTLACPYYLRTLAMRSHLSDLGSEACRKEERERAEKRVLRQQFFLVPTKSVFPYSFLALSLVQIGHVLTRSFFKIFEPLKDAVGILLTEKSPFFEGNTELALSYPMGNFRVHPLAAQAVQYFLSSILLKGPAIEYTLDLGNHNLNGPIPENLADLAQLQCLVLSHNNLSGSIPSKSSLSFSQVNIPDLSYAQHRGVFDLSYNRSLSRLTNLTTLDLSGNLLTGLIPPEFGDSLKLQGLYLGKNQLSGTIPERLGRLSSLVKLNLTSNKNFSGPVPTSFGNLKGLTHLDLSSNELSVEEAVTEQAVTESAAIEPPSVGRRTTGSEMREAAGLHFRSGNQRVKKPVVLSDPETGKKELGIELGELSCPVDAVNPIAKISPKKKEKNAKVKTSEISLVYFYLKIDRKFPFFGRQDKCHRKRRNGIGSQQLWKLLATFFPFFSSPRWVLHPKETEKALPEIHVKPDSSFSPKSQATDATAAKSADGVQRYRVILSVLRAFDNRQRKTVLSSSNAHSKQERWGKGAKRRERKVQFIESES
ncbi:hypothetical protein L1987_88307 [Smallanthus sonchifolius]|nr:hypothetical protein L1987_89881 [Smallanthus sonchifolius]KAI3664414.1 hypothetical protein L1987_89842 [Smallanthus sonchifolius]KAI3664608.1 hypothetical protein L1987_89632 [Smallanthus sonchifolius]KAI3666276.1 hypothetical protein L1987_89225 [Smallanthus sonchifolius]KAI3666455.1 hypothetical protein L1987_89039 [Smallanthus sonchifolius]